MHHRTSVEGIIMRSNLTNHIDSHMMNYVNLHSPITRLKVRIMQLLIGINSLIISAKPPNHQQYFNCSILHCTKSNKFGLHIVYGDMD